MEKPSMVAAENAAYCQNGFGSPLRDGASSFPTPCAGYPPANTGRESRAAGVDEETQGK
jgi:hypothetical protein